MRRQITPLFDDEQQKTPDTISVTSSPQSAYAVYHRSKQHVPVITPPPQNAQRSFASNGWPDRSSSSANLHQTQQSKQQNDSWRPQSPRSPHMMSQDARRHGSAPHLNSTSPLPFQKNQPSPKDQKNRGDSGMTPQAPTQMTNSERRRQFENQKKNASTAVNKTPMKSENKGPIDLRGKKKPLKRNEKKISENIELSIRTIHTKGQSRESRNRVSIRNPGVPRDKAPRKNQRKSGDNGETKQPNERPGKGESQIPNKEIKTEFKTERSETPEIQLFVEDQTSITSEQKFLVAEESPITLKNLPTTKDTTGDDIREVLQQLVSNVEDKEEHEEPIGPKTDESEYSKLTECDPMLTIKINAFSSKKTSLEADLGIGKTDSSSISFVWSQKRLILSPNNTPPATSPASDPEVSVQKNKKKFREIMERIDAHNAEKARKLRFKMFLPTAFNDLSFTETTVIELYGMFQVSSVVMHYDENGERLGSGCLKVEKDFCEKLRDWAPNLPWRAIKMQPLPKEPLQRLCVNMYLEHSCYQSDSCNQIMKLLTEQYGASEYQILYNYEEKSLRAATFKMDRDIARALNKKLRFSDEIIFDNPNTVKMFEIVGLSV